ncbi:MAG TPA: hypothetical protein DDW52_29580 [Planctomycetaceae bacterium]|nr:hypothetical protein [Planctomycetaceae bacterium]
MLRYIIVLVSIASVRTASANDWPFQVDLSGRGINVMRQEDSLARPTNATPRLATRPNLKWSEAFNLFKVAKQLDYVQLLPKVASKTEALGSYQSGWDKQPGAAQNRSIDPVQPAAKDLLVRAALDEPAPTPVRESHTLAEIGYSEHCFGPSYLPYDYSLASNQSQEYGVTALQTQAAFEFAADLHCRVSDQLISGEFATNFGERIASGIRQLSIQLENGIAATTKGWNVTVKDSLPKYAYLSSSSGMVLVPIELAQRWDSLKGISPNTTGVAISKAAVSPKSLKMVRQLTTTVRLGVASALDNIGDSFRFLSSKISATTPKVASDNDYPNPLR